MEVKVWLWWSEERFGTLVGMWVQCTGGRGGKFGGSLLVEVMIFMWLIRIFVVWVRMVTRDRKLFSGGW